jgi:hypothetical protein
MGTLTGEVQMGGRRYPRLWLWALGVAALWAGPALAHGNGGKDAAFVAATKGVDVLPFIYLGAKHMVTGYDHLLFLLGVIFFLHRLRHVALYVTMFSLGHSITLLLGVLSNIHVNPYLVDAVIGLSVAWKAFDNLGGFKSVFGLTLDNRLVVLGFGLVHGFGLATKLQELKLSPAGLIPNMIGFNVGVEIGQLLALSAAILLITAWRRLPSFGRTAAAANIVLLFAGFLLMDYQLAGFFSGKA